MAKLMTKNFSVELCEIEKFMGFQIARQLWSKEWGHPIFSKTINRDRYKELMK